MTSCVERYFRHDDRDIGAWFTDYLVTPWCRAGPYLIGLAVGIYLHGIKLKTSISMVRRLHNALVYLCEYRTLVQRFAHALNFLSAREVHRISNRNPLPHASGVRNILAL